METTQIKRPSFWNEMIPELAKELHLILIQWMPGEFDEPDDLESCEKVLRTKGEHSLDGYELAKECEDVFGIEPDSMLVDDLGAIESSVYDLKKKLTERWVSSNDLKLDLTIGTHVKFTNRHGDTSGVIVKLYPSSYEYGIRTPSQKPNEHAILKAEHVSNF